MKKARLILSAALLTVGGFSTLTMTSCTKDEVICETGYEGDNCKSEVRLKYYNTYRGTGSAVIDGNNETFTNWGVRFMAPSSGASVTTLRANLIDAADASQLAFDVTLTTNTTFNVVPFTNDGASYTGSGSVNENTASLTLTEVESGTTVVYSFPTLNK